MRPEIKQKRLYWELSNKGTHWYYKNRQPDRCHTGTPRDKTYSSYEYELSNKKVKNEIPRYKTSKTVSFECTCKLLGNLSKVCPYYDSLSVWVGCLVWLIKLHL